MKNLSHERKMELADWLCRMTPYNHDITSQRLRDFWALSTSCLEEKMWARWLDQAIEDSWKNLDGLERG